MDSIFLALAAILVIIPIFYFVFKKNDDEKLDNRKSGSITLFSEASCRPAIEKLIEAFQNANPNAHIELRSGSEKEAYEALFNDTSRLVVLPRGLSEKEKQFFSARYFTPPSVEFARDLKTGNVIKPLVLFNNQAREGLGKSFMVFVKSDLGKQVLLDLGLEPVGMKKEIR